ncbi:hypothetical protein [Tenacibaculum xiamenense]|uniref:hypothetical protein n=1 Tax=Tenacibaculum xiamenense TaxID=1261553 RepID=UPI0038B61CA6
MLKSIYGFGNALNKAQMKSINGSGGRTCDGVRYCLSGRHDHSGNPICVPCGEDGPPKE